MNNLIKKLSSNLMVKDVKDTVEFYKNNLGYELAMAVPETQDGISTEIPDGKKVVYALFRNGIRELLKLAKRRNCEKSI